VKIGSLCSGYGGLDMAVEAYYNAETVWMCDIDKYSSIVIKERWGLPNLGDLKTVDWAAVEPIDILTAGYPCQPFSTAGQRKGLEDERHIWPYIKEIISTLQPKRVILENVRGHLTLGFKEVLKDLTEIGYDAKWAIVRASDVGAPHQRARLFVIAGHTHNSINGQIKTIQKERIAKSARVSGVVTSDPNSKGFQRSWNAFNDFTDGPVTDSNSQTSEQLRRTNRPIPQSGNEIINGSNRQKCWDRFEITKREIPNPLDQGKLNAKFVEYMMGLPVGWVTDLDISRSQQLKLLGNGVVPQQAYYAIDKLESL
jgi:DNA (cytosine-5)-methyltransferase 1